MSSPRLEPPPVVARYHELDGLRGCMMLLGVVLHSAVSYMRTPLGDLWGFKDVRTSGVFDVLVAFLHTFRMPVFFVMAGFFAALLYQQRGVGRMVRNRAQRVLLPLVVGWMVVFPLTIGGFAFAQLGADRTGLAGAVRYVTSGDMFEHVQLLHLWFLFDLLVYYAVALLVCQLIDTLHLRVRQALVANFGALLQRWYAPFVLAVPTVLTLAPMRSGVLETPGTFHRPVTTLAAHGVFFAFGWLLYSRRAQLGEFRAAAWQWTGMACALFPLYGVAIVHVAQGASTGWHSLAILSLAAIAWLFVFGLTGLFVRYFAQPRPLWRYLADASYWFYLVHLPMVAWGSGVLAGLQWPAAVKYLALLSTILALCWVTYDLVVRNTLIGEILNGRRHPRVLAVRLPDTATPLNAQP